MINTLSVRAYSRQKVGHAHPFYQLVLPLHGVINISVGGFNGSVGPSECVMVKPHEIHHFTAAENARFLVADLDTLPSTLSHSEVSVFSISQPMAKLLPFIACQLETKVSAQIEQAMMTTFVAVLNEQQLGLSMSPRMRKVVHFIHEHLHCSLSIPVLAEVACLSPTQFKKQFRAQLKTSPARYILALRMEKSKALLINTDLSMLDIAEAVGYQDVSAFSRRFSHYFGLPPSKIAC
ncbi:AraC family transcriptional regulator [Alteromonas sp. C1M14]|uniref:AraC family transcriptional regulator n=1 Tax=Alteromonas sp. C1M14 TaxID=2841567 RepID=UPI001C08A3D7|nr:AraC family transcriptional regulator [Alteromonas sp. C1M14]MBU2977649.1 AraC family transcriptional regulator [Alteromonas sp. C1M14]